MGVGCNGELLIDMLLMITFPMPSNCPNQSPNEGVPPGRTLRLNAAPNLYDTEVWPLSMLLWDKESWFDGSCVATLTLTGELMRWCTRIQGRATMKLLEGAEITDDVILEESKFKGTKFVKSIVATAVVAAAVSVGTGGGHVHRMYYELIGHYVVAE